MLTYLDSAASDRFGLLTKLTNPPEPKFALDRLVFPQALTVRQKFARRGANRVGSAALTSVAINVSFCYEFSRIIAAGIMLTRIDIAALCDSGAFARRVDNPTLESSRPALLSDHLAAAAHESSYQFLVTMLASIVLLASRPKAVSRPIGKRDVFG